MTLSLAILTQAGTGFETAEITALHPVAVIDDKYRGRQ